MTTPFNPFSASWSQWKAIFTTRIEEARDRLESPGLDAVTTEGLRGEIVALRSLLELGAPRSPDDGTEAPVNYGLSRK